MFELQLNIGLDVSEKFPALRKAGIKQLDISQAIDLVYNVLEAANLNSGSIGYRLGVSDTEKTAIVKIQFNSAMDAALFIVVLNRNNSHTDSIGQDCIAVYVPSVGEGVLVGRYKEAWGDFNKEYFIEW